MNRYDTLRLAALLALAACADQDERLVGIGCGPDHQTRVSLAMAEDDFAGPTCHDITHVEAPK